MQICSNKEVQKQKDDLLKILEELSEWEQKFLVDIELKAVDCLSDKQKSKITELWESNCD